MRAGRRRLAVLAALAAGCGSGAQEEPDAAPDARQFAAHRWMRVGTSIVLPKIGRTLELVSLTSPPAVVLEGDSARCAVSGVACIRSEYRADPGENQVQSLCLICVDETGSCAGLPRASLDLEAFAPAATRGDADFFAHGEGRFYSVCHAGARLRLAPSVAPLPPLMLRAVDTYGKTGPYSLSPSEIALTRDTPLVSLTGEVLRPAAVFWGGSPPPKNLVLRGDGSVTFDPVDADSCGCVSSPELVREGDFLMISHAFLDRTEMTAVLGDPRLDAFMAAHRIDSWPSAASLSSPEARSLLVRRLVMLEVMAQLIVKFDGLYGLRAKRVRIGWKAYTPSRFPLTTQCLPGEGACRRLENELQAAEKRRIDGLRSTGYDLWAVNDLAFDDDGRPLALAGQPPDFSLFGGVFFDVSPSRPLNPGVDRTAAVVTAVERAAAETGAMPVIVSPWASPVYFYVEGEQCEARICRSDFSRYYALNEALFRTASDAFGPRLSAFAVGIFDGAHFDVREPHETRGGISLNRVNSTGYNNPLLNLYLTR